MLNAVLYQDFDEHWSYRRTITKVAFVVLYTILLPLWSIVYLITPHTKLSQKLATPLAKFLSHTCSFCWFLVILVLSAVQDKLGISLLQISWIGMKTLFFEKKYQFQNDISFNLSIVHRGKCSFISALRPEIPLPSPPLPTPPHPSP